MSAGSSKVATTSPSSNLLPEYLTAMSPQTGSPDLAIAPALLLSTPRPLVMDADSFKKANTMLVENFMMENKKILDWLDKPKVLDSSR